MIGAHKKQIWIERTAYTSPYTRFFHARRKEGTVESSKMEMRIHDILKLNDVPFVEEYTFPDLVASSGRPLRFDFAVLNDDGSLDFLIEANGKQHYSPVGKFGGRSGLSRQQYNDCCKKRYCKKHGIKLVSISYKDEDKLSYDYIMASAGYT